MNASATGGRKDVRTPSPDSSVNAWVDPEISTRLADLGPFVFDDETLPITRTLIPGPEDPPADIVRTEHIVDDRDTVRLTGHRRRDSSTRVPWIYWIHGGGLVVGNRHMDDAQLERWCRALGCACFAVEYRLAPEHPYPAALEDCWAGLRWIVGHADELDIDAGRIGVGGRSAGGGLAAALALLARGDGGPALSFLLLEYPMLDDRQTSPSSRLDGLPIWTRESNAFGWRSYLGDRVGSDDVPELAAPARARDLTGLPPTCVIVGGIDGFRDEDVEFAARLMQIGVPTELHVYPGAPHGFHLFAGAAVTRRANRDVEEWLNLRLRSSA